MHNVSLTVNGKPAVADIEPRTHLADFLRDTQNLTGTHLGCEHGVCGACTVLLDGVPARSCITFAVACQKAQITTIEGLDHDEIAAELRAAFSREHGLQCGYCTPGMIVSARDLVLRMDAADEREIRVAMSGNLCRCTGYVGIVRAIQSVIAERRARGIAAVPGGSRAVLGPAGSGHGSPRLPQGSDGKQKEIEAAPPARRATSLDPGWQPQARFAQSFTIARPPDVVWAFFGRIGDVAACLPGASLLHEPVDGHAEGQIRVKVGPIVAQFDGAAEITRNEADRTGTIVGSGKDKRSNSATRGVVTYGVSPGAEPDETRIDLSIGYTLTGVLVQFGRSGLVEDVAARLIAAFAKNIESRLSLQPENPTPLITELDAGSLVSAVFVGRLKRMVIRLFHRA